MNEIKNNQYLDTDFYEEVKSVLLEARKRVYRNIQNEMVLAYWQIGKMIVEKQDGEKRAAYGDELIKELSIQMTKDFGLGYTPRNLWYMKQFYLAFPKVNAVRAQLSWTHYRLILSLDDENTRNFYIKEAIEGNWSTRQLQRAINTSSYQRYLASKGNHENFEMLNNMPLVEFKGALMHRIDEHIFHVLRGEIMTLDNKTFLCIGGATSIDKMYRTPYISWWPEEEITYHDIDNAVANLAKVNNKVDYVITHCCDTPTVKRAFHFRRDICTDQLNFIDKIVDYKHWFFGHYHFDREISNKKTCLYQSVVKLG